MSGLSSRPPDRPGGARFPKKVGICLWMPAKVRSAKDLLSISPTGIEHLTKTSANQGFSETGAAQSAALPTDPDLAELSTLWPAIPDQARQTILTIARSATQRKH